MVQDFLLPVGRCRRMGLLAFTGDASSENYSLPWGFEAISSMPFGRGPPCCGCIGNSEAETKAAVIPETLGNGVAG